jgi:intracellular sulfur oxidation DsrE/DsrF family protein/thioredoxin-related protein
MTNYHHPARLLILACLLSVSAMVLVPRSAPVAGEAGEAVEGPNGLYVQDWFHESFLDMSEDLAEAAEQGKHLAILWEQRGCPYCREMHAVNLADDEIRGYIQENFVVLQLDMWGSREVTDFDGEALEERAMARSDSRNSSRRASTAWRRKVRNRKSGEPHWFDHEQGGQTMRRIFAMFAVLAALLAVAPLNAEAVDAKYGKQKVVYHINYEGGEDDKRYRGAMRNIQNHINAVGAENLDIKVVLHGNGVSLLKSAVGNQKLQSQVVDLKIQDVEFHVCNNTLVGRKIDYEDELFEVFDDMIVPSGVAELSHLQQQGLAAGKGWLARR